MKTKNKILIIFQSFLIVSCNIYLGEDPPSILDIKYKNETSNDLKIITYSNGDLVDNINISKKSTCSFNNVKMAKEIVENPVFKLYKDSYSRDSILIVSDNVLSDANSKKYKAYILRKNDLENTLYGYKEKASAAFYLYWFEKLDQKQRSTLALNKGNLVKIRFEEKDFVSSLKMYDYEKRGL